MDPILTDTTSPSLIDLSSEQITNPHAPLPVTSLVDYSDSDTENSYTLMDLDNQNNISHLGFTNNNDHTNTDNPTIPVFIDQLIQPSTSSLFDQQEQNVSRKSLESQDNNACIDSEDSWKPASSSSDSDEDESAQKIDEETSVGKRGYRKIKPIPKRLLSKKNRNVGKSVQPNLCMNKRCGNSCANKLTEDDRNNILENYWGLGCDKR